MTSMTFASGLRDKLTGLKSLVVGLGVTGRNFFKPQRTTHYPRKVVDSVVTFRGHIELIADADPERLSLCIACGSCERQCPSNCITVRPEKSKEPKEDTNKAVPANVRDGKLVPEGAKAKPKAKPKQKHPGVFKLDYTLCSLCGLCVQVCPVDALRFSTDVYLAATSRSAYHYDLINRLAGQLGHSDKEH
jgi:NADH-quinone oxidoreductase subunit I